MDKNMELAYQLMEAIRQTAEWDHRLMEYPGAVEANAKLAEVMEKVPDELVDELMDAFCDLSWANECACMLFGFHLSCSAFRAAANPAEFFSYAKQKKGRGDGETD